MQVSDAELKEATPKIQDAINELKKAQEAPVDTSSFYLLIDNQKEETPQ